MGEKLSHYACGKGLCLLGIKHFGYWTAMKQTVQLENQQKPGWGVGLVSRVSDVWAWGLGSPALTQKLGMVEHTCDYSTIRQRWSGPVGLLASQSKWTGNPRFRRNAVTQTKVDRNRGRYLVLTSDLHVCIQRWACPHTSIHAYSTQETEGECRGKMCKSHREMGPWRECTEANEHMESVCCHTSQNHRDGHTCLAQWLNKCRQHQVLAIMSNIYCSGMGDGRKEIQLPRKGVGCFLSKLSIELPCPVNISMRPHWDRDLVTPWA